MIKIHYKTITSDLATFYCNGKKWSDLAFYFELFVNYVDF